MIYSLKYNDFTKLMREFGKTVYGKITFVVCYTPFLMGFLACIINYIFLFKKIISIPITGQVNIIVATILFLCLGSYGYYNQLRKFAESKKK